MSLFPLSFFLFCISLPQLDTRNLFFLPLVLSYGVESFTCSVQHLKRNFLSFSLFLFYGRRRGDGTKRIIKEQQAKGNLELAFSSSLFLQSALHTGGTISKIQAINIIGRMPLLSTAGKLLLLFFDCMLDCSVDAIIHFFFFFFVVRNPTGGEKSKKAWKFGRSCGITLSTGKAVEGSLVISLRWNYQRLARSCIVLLVFSFPPTSPALQQQQQPISFLSPPTTAPRRCSLSLFGSLFRPAHSREMKESKLDSLRSTLLRVCYMEVMTCLRKKMTAADESEIHLPWLHFCHFPLGKR